jgi:hypothetical protein
MSSSQASPQFDKADFGEQQPQQGDVCHRCHQAIIGAYYRANGAMTCASCANILQHEAANQPGGRFSRALVFGAAGALLGIVLYSAVGIITGLEIGYVSLAVGFIVAKAILKGSGGIGGRKYQIAAVALTYFAVSLSAIPIGIHMMRQQENGPSGASSSAKSGTTAKDAGPTDSAAEVQESADSGDADKPAKAEGKPAMGLLMGIGILLGIGLASPFLALSDPVHGVIGLVILFVGMNIAWRMTAGTKRLIDGPYNS